MHFINCITVLGPASSRTCKNWVVQMHGIVLATAIMVVDRNIEHRVTINLDAGSIIGHIVGLQEKSRGAVIACHIAPPQQGIGLALTARQHAAAGEAIHAQVVATTCCTCIAKHVTIRVLLHEPRACIHANAKLVCHAALARHAHNVDMQCMHAHAVGLVVGVCLAKHASLHQVEALRQALRLGVGNATDDATVGSVFLNQHNVIVA